MDATVLEETVGYQLVQTAKKHRHLLGSALEGLGLHAGQELVLVTLANSDDLRQSELADRLGVEPPTVTKTVRYLEKAGLVERHEDPDDARARQITLTENGEDLIMDIRVAWNGVEEPMLDGFTLEERILLRRMLLKLSENLSGME